MTARLLAEMVRVALNAIQANKLRSLLTITGNVVAVASIVTLVSLIEGISDEVKDVIVSEVGADAFIIERRGLILSEEDREKARNNPRITLEDADAVRQFSANITAVMAAAARNGAVAYRNRVLENAQIQGVTREFTDFSNYNAAAGRLMTRSEVDRHRNVVVLGSGTADRLFENLDPIDRRIKIQGVPFRVVGVSRPKGSTFGRSQDEYAIIPLGSFRRLFGSRPSIQLQAQARNPSSMSVAVDEATVALRIERQLKATEDNNFGLFTSDTILGIYNQATTGIFSVLIGVVGLALVVAGIVVMNIMLMAVSERTREIGLRKALGARRRDILCQILSESVVLSALGGLVGTGLGATAALLIDRLSPVPASIHVWSVVLAITMTALVGLFFGLYPASRAASLDPIDALGRSD